MIHSTVYSGTPVILGSGSEPQPPDNQATRRVDGRYTYNLSAPLSSGVPGGPVVKNSPANAGAKGDMASIPGSEDPLEKILWRRKWQPTPVFLPGKPHRQRNLVGYNPWCRKESDRT